jgi:hypothetical protein
MFYSRIPSEFSRSSIMFLDVSARSALRLNLNVFQAAALEPVELLE